MSGVRLLDEHSVDVQTHLTILQGIIQRMAVNSRSCKVWCVTLVSAVMVLVAQTGEPNHALIALVPTVLFLVLDTYYLAQERAYIRSYRTFVGSLHAGELARSEIYKMTSTGMGMRLVLRCLGSASIYLFYPLVVVTILFAQIRTASPSYVRQPFAASAWNVIAELFMTNSRQQSRSSNHWTGPKAFTYP